MNQPTKQNKKLSYDLRSKLRYFLLNSWSANLTDRKDFINCLRLIHSELTKAQTNKYLITYTCVLVGRFSDYKQIKESSYHHWKQVVEITKIILQARYKSKDEWKPISFEILCKEEPDFNNVELFRLALVEYCYKTLTKKGRI